MSEALLATIPGLIATLIVILIVVLIIKRKVEDNKLMNTVTDRTRGTRAERRLVVSLLREGSPADDIYHDLYLEYRPGYYSQIDVVAIVPAGIIVFEEKDYSGWIFGKGWQKQWTQVLNYGKEKNHFYNPVKQNESHINRLKTAICDNNGRCPRIFSFIIFHGNCEFRDVSEIPADTIVAYAHHLGRYLRQMDAMPAADYGNLDSIRRTLRQAARNGQDSSVIAKHLQNVERWKSSH